LDKLISCRTIDGGSVDVPLSKLRFRPAGYGVVARGPELLLVMFPALGKYSLPGGGLDIGESVEDAVRREVLEETGYEVEIGELLHFKQEFFFHPFIGACNSLSFFYLCRPVIQAGEPSVPDLPGAVAEWVDVTDSDAFDNLHPFIWEPVRCYLEILRSRVTTGPGS
jgi:ADP-ribose pyrophosphatase YjhB (NUDIX family)